MKFSIGQEVEIINEEPHAYIKRYVSLITISSKGHILYYLGPLMIEQAFEEHEIKKVTTIKKSLNERFNF